MFALFGTKTFILNVSSVEYFYQIKQNGANYIVSAFYPLGRVFYINDSVAGNTSITGMLITTNRYRIADLDHDANFGNNDISAGNVKASSVYADNIYSSDSTLNNSLT